MTFFLFCIVFLPEKGKSANTDIPHAIVHFQGNKMVKQKHGHVGVGLWVALCP
jgi:hypothetical protein